MVRPAAMMIQQGGDGHQSQQSGLFIIFIVSQNQKGDENPTEKPTLGDGADVQIWEETEKNRHSKNLRQHQWWSRQTQRLTESHGTCREGCSCDDTSCEVSFKIHRVTFWESTKRNALFCGEQFLCLAVGKIPKNEKAPPALFKGQILTKIATHAKFFGFTKGSARATSDACQKGAGLC